MNFAEQNLTGKASIDKPWLNFYPEEFRNLDIPRITMESFLKMKIRMKTEAAFEYYGNKITWKQFWAEVDIAARALKALGFKEGDRIPVLFTVYTGILYPAFCSRESWCNGYLS